MARPTKVSFFPFLSLMVKNSGSFFQIALDILHLIRAQIFCVASSKSEICTRPFKRLQKSGDALRIGNAKTQI